MAKFLGSNGLAYLWSKVRAALNTKQESLVSGTNIKTINNQSILGEGNISIDSGGATPIINHGDESIAVEEFVPNTYILLSNGNVASYYGWKSSGFIDISSFYKIKATKSYRYSAYYDSDQNFISAVTIDTSYKKKPDNAVYIRISGSNSDMDSLQFSGIYKSYIIQPNILHVWEEIEVLDISFAVPVDNTILNDYMLQFKSGSTATNLSMPSDIKWVEAPNIETNATYQISVVNNLGIIVKFT